MQYQVKSTCNSKGSICSSICPQQHAPYQRSLVVPFKPDGISRSCPISSWLTIIPWRGDVQVLSMADAAVSSQLLSQLCQYWPEGIGFRSSVLKTEMLSLTECYFISSHVWAYKCLGQHPIFHSFGQSGHIYELQFKNLLLHESSWLKSKGIKKIYKSEII